MTTITVCGKCGQKVFYYRNEFGSRVLFDELGGDWPKHDCLGNYQNSSKMQFKPVVFSLKKERPHDYK